MTMKKQYQTPDIDLVRFNDVITASAEVPTGEGGLSQTGNDLPFEVEY